MKIRNATEADLPFIAEANAALAVETDGKVLDPALLRPGVEIQSVYVLPSHLGGGMLRALFGHLTGLARTDPRICGIRLYVDGSNDRAQDVYGRLGMHRSNYAIMETVYRGPESHEEARPC